jgi:PAS domain S-box-containing protein
MSTQNFTVPQKLRNEAEARLRLISANPVSVDSSERLLHELRVHQVELEMQNEELRCAQVELAKMRDRYVDLFEFAPIAYITLNASGVIININQTGASLLAADRGGLRHGPFEQFVMADDQAKWRLFLRHSQIHGSQHTCELRMRRRDGTIFYGSLCSALVPGEDKLPELRLALSDISDMKRSELARQELESRLSKLTVREKQVLALAVSGMINKDIAVQLQIGLRAVENYRSRIHVKTASVSLLELSHQAATAGITFDEIGLP